MSCKWKKFLKRKDVLFTLRRYVIDALGTMAQGLFCTLLVGTIFDTIGSGEGAVQDIIGGLCSAMVGPGITVDIGFAPHRPSLVIFSLTPVGFAVMSLRENDPKPEL